MKQSPSWKANSCSVRFPAFCRTQRFISVVTGTHHWSLSWARLNQFTSSCPVPLIYTVILFSHLLLYLPNGPFLQIFLPKLCMDFSSVHVTCSTNLILLDLIIPILFGKEYNYGASHYAIFDRLLLLPLPQVGFWSYIVKMKWSPPYLFLNTFQHQDNSDTMYLDWQNLFCLLSAFEPWLWCEFSFDTSWLGLTQVELL
jgi:hypothetical protein